jgi:hypothetical protein
MIARYFLIDDLFSFSPPLPMIAFIIPRYASLFSHCLMPSCQARRQIFARLLLHHYRHAMPPMLDAITPFRRRQLKPPARCFRCFRLFSDAADIFATLPSSR